MIKSALEGWNRFWFEPISVQWLTPIRVAVCLVSLLWFASFLPNLDSYFAANGLLSTDLAAKLIDFEETALWQSWSPLVWTDSTGFYRGWLVLGILTAIVGAIGLGGRTTLTVLLVLVLCWAHRIAWLQGPVEPALIAAISYLIVEPGTTLAFRKDSPTVKRTWRGRVALRLLQTHWWILIAAGTLSQLASVIWWRGEAAWWLASANRSWFFSTEALRGNASLINGLSHSIVVVELLALWLITMRTLRPLGIMLGLLVALVYAGLADHVLYGLLLAAILLAFRATTQPPSTRYNEVSSLPME